MIAILGLLVVVMASMLVNRIATIALTLTGMSHEEARFQARAAMSGVGLTTNQPDEIVAHPVRRRIVFWLMLVGSAGIVTTIASLVLSFKGGSAGARAWRAAVLAGALLALWLVSRTGPVDRALSSLLARLLHIGGYAERDRGTLLRLPDGYVVAELQLRAGDWLAGRPLNGLHLQDEGVTVLGIKAPDGRYAGRPDAHQVLQPGDTLTLYGRAEQVSELDGRRAGAGGEAAHEARSNRQQPASALSVAGAAQPVRRS